MYLGIFGLKIGPESQDKAFNDILVAVVLDNVLEQDFAPVARASESILFVLQV